MSDTLQRCSKPGGKFGSAAGVLVRGWTGATLAALLAAPAPAQIISEFAGNPPPLVNGSALGQFIDNHDGKVAVDAAGNVYLALQDSSRIVKINPTANTLTIIAGTGEVGLSGDGGPATSATLNHPSDVAVDAAGNLFVADHYNHRIRRISTSGIITTVAGSNYGFGGDGGPATGAMLAFPLSVEVDAAGNLYIAEINNHRIRKVSAAGIISTIAGNGTEGNSGDGGPATAATLGFVRGVAVSPSGTVCLGDLGFGVVRCISPAGIITTLVRGYGFSGDGGPVAAALINSANDVAFDSQSNLYIADTYNNRIRTVNPAGIISTVAGSGASGFSGDGSLAIFARISLPTGVAVDAAGNVVIIGDSFPIRRVTPAGIISSIAGRVRFGGDGGNAINSLLNNPTGMARDANGNLYIADQANHRVRKINTAGIISTIAGTGEDSSTGDGGPATLAALNSPSGVAVDAAGNVYVAENSGHRVRRIAVSGSISTIAGTGLYGSTGDGGPATSARLALPEDVALDAAGNLYVSERGANKVRRIAANGTITTVAGSGIYGFAGDGGPATAAQLRNPAGLAVDQQGNLLIADSLNYRVRKVNTAGIISTFAGNGTYGNSGDGGPATSAQIYDPARLATDGSGNLWFTASSKVRFVDAATGVIARAAGIDNYSYFGDGGPALDAAFRNVTGIALMGDGRLLLADSGNHRIRQVGFGIPVVVTLLSQDPGSNLAIDFGVYFSPFAAVLTQGTTHRLFANPARIVTTNAERYVFANWADGVATTSRTIVVTAPITYTANYTRQFFLASQSNPAGSGSVTSNWYNAGSQATVQAAPAAGYQFASFSGALTGSTNPQQLLMDAAKTVTGNFTPVQTNPGGRRFVPVYPCRVADTRNAAGAFGGPFLAANTTRSIPIPHQIGCNIPLNAAAYSLNVTVVPKEPLGFLTIFPTGAAQPFVSTLNSLDGRIKANAAIVPAGTGGAVTVFVNNATDVILDINGYFVDPAINGNGLAFYPITPCRVMDTRNANGSLGGPIIAADSSRDISVRSSGCGVPTTAVAYSVNATVVPPAALGFLTLWSAGQRQPGVSTLNAPTGAITANAAIVWAGTNGAISAFMSSASHLVLDINGYFAAPGAANAQSFFPVSPCRLLDTRGANGEFGGPVLAASAARSYRLPLANCGLPAAATAYSLNATVVPSASLGFLTLWPTGQGQPFVSTLNAIDGTITSNAAIVPAGTAGAVSSFVTDQSHLILDTNGYFAP